MSITIIAGNIVLNRWGLTLTEVSDRPNINVGTQNDFVCVSDDNETNTLNFDVRIHECEYANLYGVLSRLENMVRMANTGKGHLQYRYIYDGGQRVYEIMNGSVTPKDLNSKYAKVPFLTVDLQLTVRKSIVPTLQLFPVRVPTDNVAGAEAAWGGDIEAILVTPDSSMFTQPDVATLGAVTNLDEITNSSYAPFTLKGKYEVEAVMWPQQPIVPLLPRHMNDTGRIALGASDIYWLSIQPGDSIGGIVLADASDNILGWIPYTNWAYGDMFNSGIIVPDGGTIKFKTNQLGLVIAP